MSDTQGERPENTSTPASTPDDAAAASQPPAAANPTPQNPTAQNPTAQNPTAQGQPVPPRPPLPTATGGWQQGTQPTLPYGTPRPPAYAGQPPYGAASQTQPTLPLGGFGQPVGGTAPTVTTAPAAEKKSGAGKVVGLLVAAALVGGAAGLGGAYAGVNVFGQTTSTAASGPTTVTVNDTDSVNQTTAIAAKVVPSVVTISASSGSSGGTGSGVVLTSDGYVLTNTHVVTLDGATGSATISVTTSDGKVYDATVVGTDPTYDLAVIKLEGATDMTPIEWADSSALNVGDETVAVGAPLGLSNTVTTGIVSALNRSIEIASSAAPDSADSDSDSGQGGESGDSPFFFDFGDGQSQQSTSETIKIAVIQTDAAINPGNSGGALVDSEGKLIGINVAIASASDSSSGQSGSIGVGFSIPSNIAKRVSDELIADGAATHGLLGANVMSAASVEGTEITGAYIDEAVAGGAAAAAGLQKGDIITVFNGVPITDSVDLTAQVRAAAAGSEATLTYVRDGESHDATVTLGTLEQ
ncbi:trypsin-like peptidase domain-containing protein [Microbacterium fluvii]|uniref:Trypsin-like peptidase domain-containing protein n=1 Tax=Microbacterium fluvii TaxID=415215 RepID=A0ABW2HGL0_9MICO|nr:trypsin-like peptidase domain-containing protein [Microbacterium fluvii]MCU4672218.1 trypsin-like peptidase domain-containing protein [Microbacterium fluvii]